MTDPDRELYIPPVQAPRGGISYPTHWDMVDAELARMGTIHGGALFAAGGFCAPVSSLYDIVDRTPWTHADLPLWWDIDVDAWLFPRLTATRRALARFRRRCRAARAAFTTGDPDPED